jgi:hypothetical protein
MVSHLLRVGLIVVLAVGPAQGQTLRSVTVPADATVAVPPRGQSLPTPSVAAVRPPVTNPAPVVAGAGAPVVLRAATPMPLSPVPFALLPLVAAAVLGGSLAGSGGGGTGAPASTTQ